MTFTRHTTRWSTMLLAIAATCLLTGQVSRAAPGDKVLHDFNGASAKDAWIAVNDNVMGGVSKGGPSFTEDGTMVFSGTLSLENRGGFSSVRTRRSRTNLSDYDHLVVRVRGDGRTYWLTVDTNARIPAGSYRVMIETRAGQWQTVRAPFSKFQATSFGRVLPVSVPLDRSKVESVGFLLADKKAGPFRLEVDSIKAEAAAAEPAPSASTAPKQAAGNDVPKDIVDTAVAAGSFKTLAAALKAAGLVETLKGKGPFTVFAPTDEAFAKLPKGTVESLLKPENKDKLTAILTYHVAAGRTEIGRQSLKSLQGSPLNVSPGDYLVVNGVKVVTPNIAASNGVIHVIDRVLLPKLPEPTPADRARKLIELAIHRGVPLFNDGQTAACAAIYEIAAKSLLQTGGDALTDADRETLRKALGEIADSDSSRSNAWTLRRALDRVYSNLKRR
jgi:uncharacterized surface protein with fasciclin (FAS1) repeats